MQNSQTNWQVQVQGQIYEADLDELKQWISEGAVAASDRVKRGNLRWLPIEKVPELYDFFNSGEYEYAPVDAAAASSDSVADASAEEAVWDSGDEKICCLHRESDAVYACAVCKKFFCKICPNSYGGSVRLCPFCGSLCRSATEPLDALKKVGAVNKPYCKLDENSNRPQNETGVKSQISNVQRTVSRSLRNGKDAILNVISSRFSRLFKDEAAKQ